jgi:hypothetical protein
MADLRPGSTTEVKFTRPEETIAQWIKVEPAN